MIELRKIANRIEDAFDPLARALGSLLLLVVAIGVPIDLHLHGLL